MDSVSRSHFHAHTHSHKQFTPEHALSNTSLTPTTTISFSSPFFFLSNLAVKRVAWPTVKYSIAQFLTLLLAIWHVPGRVFTPSSLLVAIVPVTTAPAGPIGLNIELCFLAVCGAVVGSVLSLGCLLAGENI